MISAKMHARQRAGRASADADFGEEERKEQKSEVVALLTKSSICVL